MNKPNVVLIDLKYWVANNMYVITMVPLIMGMLMFGAYQIKFYQNKASKAEAALERIANSLEHIEKNLNK